MDLGTSQSTYLRRLVLMLRGVDSTAFDAKAYYEQLITTSSLPSLLRKENELLNGTRAI